MVRLFALVLTFIAAACQSNARSQEQVAITPQIRATAPDPSELNESITRSRHTAITSAVQLATPAIVSINVIEVQRVVYEDPLASWLNDPWFAPFFSQRRSRVMEHHVQNLGSGFLISPDGYIITNHHVVGNAIKVTVSLANGNTLDAQIVGSDQATDLALIKVEPHEPLHYLSFTSETEPIVGEWAIAMGNPFGLFEASEPSVTVGVVSAADRDLGRQRNSFYNDMIQTDASINRGNSGGPLINALGEVIGVNTAIYTESGGSVGLGFAVPAARAQRIIEELRTNGRVDRSYYTGFRHVEITAEIASALDLEKAGGLVVAEVDPGSPAQKAGLRPYDVILAMSEAPIEDVDDYLARLYDFRPGDTVAVSVLREGQPLTVQMQIGRRTTD